MKIICIGRNYLEHVAELKNPLPEVPIFFMKPESSIVRNNKPFYYPDFSEDIHHEVEIVYKISRVGKRIEKRFAHRYYQEIGVGIDFTARDLQDKAREQGLPWEPAKAFDHAAPISKFSPKERYPDLNNINFRLDLNGKTVQKGNTRDMVISIDEIISYVSVFLTLKMGDLIYTGTPAGVGPVKKGDHLQAYLEEEKKLDFYVR